MRITFFGDSLTAGLPGSSYYAILLQRLPEHTLINQGKGNDTVVSLYRRISSLPPGGQLDLAFLWIGVNDVPWRDWWPQRAFSAAVGQPRARDLDQFRSYYKATLDLLCQGADRVVAVAPLLRGEDLTNRWNRRLEGLAGEIQDLTCGYQQASFLDLRDLVARELAGKSISTYTGRSPFRVGTDILTLRSEEQIERRAKERGLHLTLDGLHLNRAGAELVAGAFARVIQQAATSPVKS